METPVLKGRVRRMSARPDVQPLEASPAAAAATSALRQLYGSQKQIPFNFGFSEVKVPCDVVSVRIGVTDGSIECDVDLPLKLSQQSSLPDVSESTLAIMRQYVAAARRVIVDIDEEGASGLEDQFVAARATGRLPSRDAEGRLHQWVSVSKLKARALGSVNMNPPHYNDAFDLEEERANRLKERMKLMRAMAPPEITIRDIYGSILPFVLVMVAALSLIMAFPEIALWLPNYIYGK